MSSIFFMTESLSLSKNFVMTSSQPPNSVISNSPDGSGRSKGDSTPSTTGR